MQLKTASIFVGSRVRLLRDIDLRPYTVVKANELGTIIAICPDFIDIRMDTLHAHLPGNVAWLCLHMFDVAAHIALLTEVMNTCV